MGASELVGRTRRLLPSYPVPNPWTSLLGLSLVTAVAAFVGILLLTRYLYGETLPPSQSAPPPVPQHAPALLMAGDDVSSVPRGQEVDEAVNLPMPPARTLESTTESSPKPAALVPEDGIDSGPLTPQILAYTASNDDILKLASLGVALNGLDFDEIVGRVFPDAEQLPLDSSDLGNVDLGPALPVPEQPADGPLQLAIIVDDGGYGGWVTEEILAMPNTLTLSILPHAPYSYETAQRAVALGFEVMLHMPMENVSGKTTYPGEITVDMDVNEMLDLTNQALADVPGAVGINNHTGSKFTSNADAMRLWLGLIQDSGLFFIDSRTTRTACAYEVADEMGIPCASRDLFLDHHSGPNYIRARFLQIIDIVKKKRSAIAICHFRPNTVPVLKEMFPEFEREGIEIVHASTMVR